MKILPKMIPILTNYQDLIKYLKNDIERMFIVIYSKSVFYRN